MRTGRVGEAVDRVWPLAALALAMVMLGAAAASGHLFPDANPEGGSPLPTVQPSLTARTALVRPPQAAPSTGTNWLALLVWAALALLVALALLAAVHWLRGRGQRPAEPLLDPLPPGTTEPQPALRDDLLDTARAAHTDLSTATDVRDAVIALYLAFEAAVARSGVARLAHETPGDLLARTLRSIDVPADAARHLVELYERVRFGHASSDEAMRGEAQACLSAITGALAGAAR